MKPQKACRLGGISALKGSLYVVLLRVGGCVRGGWAGWRTVPGPLPTLALEQRVGAYQDGSQQMSGPHLTTGPYGAGLPTVDFNV